MDDLKREIKTQFFSENVAYLAQCQLRELKQIGTIHEYVKKFLGLIGLMLDIKDISKEDKLFYFFEGLKPWARTELQRQRVQDLATTQIATERLTDYATESTQPKKAQPSALSNTSTSEKLWKLGQSKSGGVDKKPTEFNSSLKSVGSMNIKSTLSCWLCNGPHKASQCPHKSKLSALQASLAQEEKGREKEEDEC